MGLFSKLFSGLKKTKDAISNKFENLFKKEINDDFYEELEEILYTSDIGVSATEKIIDEMKSRVKKEHIKTAEEAKQILRDIMEEILTMGNDSKGIYTPSSLYASIAKGYISALGQAFKSYEDYSADGEWSGMDTGATMVDASVDGLYSMVDALTFGLISEESTQVSADQISDSLKSWASGIGDRSAHYILSDPNLTRQYQESGELGKIFLTFYAAVKS